MSDDTTLKSPEIEDSTTEDQSPVLDESTTEETQTPTPQDEHVEEKTEEQVQTIDEVELNRRSAKYARIEAELAEKKKRLEELEASPVVFASEVNKMLEEPTYKAEKEQEWIDDPNKYEDFRKKHLEVYKVDLGSLESYLASQAVKTNVYDPRIKKVEEKRLEEKILTTVARQNAEYELERHLFDTFPDADPTKAVDEEDRSERIKRLSLSKLWAGDRVKNKLNTNFNDAVIDAYASINTEKLVRNAQKVGEAVGRYTKTNEGVGVGVNVNSNTATGGKREPRLTPEQTAIYNKMINSGNKSAAELFKGMF